jgi:GNAT superfamily N-acetyltransferase
MRPRLQTSSRLTKTSIFFLRHQIQTHKLDDSTVSFGRSAAAMSCRNLVHTITNVPRGLVFGLTKMMNRLRIACVVLLLLCHKRARGFVAYKQLSIPLTPSIVTVTCLNKHKRVITTWRLCMFFAEEAVPSERKQDDVSKSNSKDGKVAAVDVRPAVELVISNNEGFLNAVGAFLVDSFWLSSDHHNLGDNVQTLSSDVRMNLVVEQCADLQEKYGEMMGKRLARACVIGALHDDTKELIGVGTLKETLLINNDILESEKAELIAKNAVASLGPKQRRQYKDAPIPEIASELLSSSKAICVLSNLSVGRNVRRRGVGTVLCEEIAALAGDWGYDEVHLLVEKENNAARTLYEQKLGFVEICMNEAAPALRVNVQTGAFQEVQADTLVLVKKL